MSAIITFDQYIKIHTATLLDHKDSLRSIALFFGCAAFIDYSKLKTVKNIEGSPKDNKLDYTKIETVS